MAQLADKIAEVTPPPFVARVSSSGDDNCTLTACIAELDRQVAALSTSPLVRFHHCRHDGTQEVRHALRESHQPLTSAGTTAVLKSAQRDAPRLYVAAGKHGRQSLAAASNFNNSASSLFVTDRLTKMSFLFDTAADLCVYPRPRLRERRTQSNYE